MERTVTYNCIHDLTSEQAGNRPGAASCVCVCGGVCVMSVKTNGLHGGQVKCVCQLAVGASECDISWTVEVFVRCLFVRWPGLGSATFTISSAFYVQNFLLVSLLVSLSLSTLLLLFLCCSLMVSDQWQCAYLVFKRYFTPGVVPDAALELYLLSHSTRSVHNVANERS